MAVIILEPRSATLVAGSAEAPFWRRGKGSILVMSVRLPHQAGIWLEGDERAFAGDLILSVRAESTEAVEAFLAIANETDQSLEKGDVVGSVRYSPAVKASGDGGGARRAGISFEVLVPAQFMASILRHTKNGRPPQKIWLDVKGLGYRNTARGKSAPLLWPGHEERPALPITDISLEFSHRRQTDFSLTHSEPNSDDPKVAKKATARALHRLEPLWVQLSVRMVWVVWLMVAVIVGLALWFWS